MQKITETNGLGYCTMPDGSRQCTGANYGRRDTGTLADVDAANYVTLWQVPLYDGDYDKGGAYYGYTRGSNVYEIQGESESDVIAEIRKAGSTLSLLWDLACENPDLVKFRCQNRNETDTETDLTSLVSEMRSLPCVLVDYTVEALDHAVTTFLWCHEHQRKLQDDYAEPPDNPDDVQPTDMELGVKWQIALWRLVRGAEAFRCGCGGEQMPASQLGHELGMMAAGTGCGMDQVGEKKGWPRAFRDANPTTHHAFENLEILDSGLVN